MPKRGEVTMTCRHCGHVQSRKFSRTNRTNCSKCGRRMTWDEYPRTATDPATQERALRIIAKQFVEASYRRKRR